MSLKNFQYNRILSKYDEQQLLNKHLLDSKRAVLRDKIPEYSLLEDEFIALNISQARASLLNDEKSLEEYKVKSQMLSNKKKQLLTQNGYPSDYLDPSYRCKNCKDTGFIGNDKCHCYKQAIVNVLYEQANLGTILEKENFNSFRLDYYDDGFIDKALNLSALDNINRVLLECKRFVKNFNKSHENILFYGNTGVGKTFLCNCIAKELLDRSCTVVYLTSFELFDILEKNKFSKSIEEKNEIRDKFRYIFSSDLLIIDDLGTELVNSFIASQVYLCINERQLNQKSTIISTNLSLDDIGALYSERVFSRIISNYKVLKVIGDDIRLKMTFNP